MGVFSFFKYFVISFPRQRSTVKDHIVIGFLMQIPYLKKNFFLSYSPECSCPIRLQNFLNCNISRRKSGEIKVNYLHAGRQSLKLKVDHVLLVGCFHPCLDMPKVLWNKSPLSLEKVDCLDFFHTVRHAWKLKFDFGHFYCVWWGMPKVLQNNKSPISLERYEWLSWFFAYSQILMKATNWLCHFCWVWSYILRCAQSPPK